MPNFVCPACGKEELELILSLELPPGADDDELSLQTLRCRSCDLHGIAVYRENRRGALDSESWSHTGYAIDRDALEKLRTIILACPSPENRLCPCKAHSGLAKLNWSSRNRDLQVLREFEMKLAGG